MSIEVKIPSVGESITSGVISVWHKRDGEQVKEGETLFTLDTEKVSTEIVAEKSGTLHIKAEEGAEVQIGQVVATIDEGGEGAAPAEEKPAEAKAGKAKPAEPKRAEEKPAEAKHAEEKPEAESKPAPKKKAAHKKEPVLPPLAPRVEAPPMPGVGSREPQIENIVAAAREGAEEEPQAEAPEEPKAAAPAAETRQASDKRATRKKLSPLRRKIASQLVMAQHNAAILTTFNECDMTAVMELRAKMQESFQKQHGVKLGMMSFFIKATVKALKEIPNINGWLEGDEFVQNHYYDIGVAVGTERGLMVPVIRDADQKSFAQLEKDIVDYAGKARDGKMKFEDLQGGVFTISNGGVYGSLLSTPILNPPQSGILGLHKMQQRPVALDGQVVIRPMMYLALSYDHRVVDGREAVTFLIKVKECIEEPARLLLEV
jgi:2-oxoglutarate dehydrogenase E2 component (dihydrolipoamide succinyltransferase)